MNPYLQEIWAAVSKGGAVMAALAALSLLLYKSLFSALEAVRRSDLGKFTSRAERQEALRRFRQNLRSRLRYARGLAVAAPLLGLLGTVVGMLDTFDALSSEKTQSTTQSVADGISVALITTEAGLVIAIPALFLAEWIKRKAQWRELRAASSEPDHPGKISPTPNPRRA